MQAISVQRYGRALCLALALGAAAPAFAVPLLDMRVDDLVAMAPALRKSLNLNTNQQTLWQQVEGRTRSVLRERQARRERLQQQALALAAQNGVELRELAKLAEAEEAASVADNRALRDAWLTVNDALDDRQRQQVATFVLEQLQRVPDTDGPPREGRAGGRGEGGPGGRGGMGGMGGHGGRGPGGGMGQ